MGKKMHLSSRRENNPTNECMVGMMSPKKITVLLYLEMEEILFSFSLLSLKGHFSEITFFWGGVRKKI